MKHSRSPGSTFAAVLLLPMLVAWARLASAECVTCPIKNMVPTGVPEISLYLGFDCLHGGDSNCPRLATFIDSLALTCNRPDLSVAALADEQEWKDFLRTFTGPCDPIPKKYLDPANAHFKEVAYLIQPNIQIHPREEYPPVPLTSVTQLYKRAGATTTGIFGKERKLYRYKPTVGSSMFGTNPLSAADCIGKIDDGRCCGMLKNRSLHLDVTNADNMISVSFATVHQFGTMNHAADDIADDANVSLPGSHNLDTEAVRFTYQSAGPGKVRLDTMVFSRHGLATSRTQACNGNNYAFGGGLTVTPPSLIRSACVRSKMAITRVPAAKRGLAARSLSA